MARVPKTSGQGVSRKAYQTAYRMGARGTGTGGGALKTEKPDMPTSSRGENREYAKAEGGTMNVSYGNTIDPENLKEVAATPPALKGVREVKELPPKKWK